MSLIDSDDNKNKILKKFYEISANQGCDDQTLEQSFTECNFDPKLKDIFFENGLIDLIDFAIDKIDEQTKLELDQFDFSNLGISAKIRKIIQIKLKIIDQNYAAFCSIASYLRNNFKLTSKITPLFIKKSYQFADFTWYEIGDKSTDYNFYSKRILLSKIHLKTLLYFSKNNSIPNSLKYFDSQITNIIIFSKVKNELKEIFNFISCQSDKNNVQYRKDFLKQQISKLPFLRLYNGK
ncbi:COQ9 family protein [Rickettsiales bacterium]|nr:COQ9 family protein [Rickettsiales bacterium]MDB2550300.1 COQ9 family protein [Rickettsiales bacterium]